MKVQTYISTLSHMSSRNQLVIALSNMNAYRLSRGVLISFIYVQLIAALLQNRWSSHF